MCTCLLGYPYRMGTCGQQFQPRAALFWPRNSETGNSEAWVHQRIFQNILCPTGSPYYFLPESRGLHSVANQETVYSAHNFRG